MRTTIRSMITAEGCIIAMDDGTITWTPRRGGLKRVRLDAQASLILGLIGPKGKIDRVLVGYISGAVNIISLSQMTVIDRYVTGKSKVRSLCSSSISGECILVGCENGSVYLVGQNVPDRAVELFELDGPASAMRVVGQSLHIQQGWKRLTLDWTGEEVSKHSKKKGSLLLA